MQQIRSTRAAARSEATGVGYQMSSHTVMPTRMPATSITSGESPARKYRASSNTP